jgi:hypothetical protein
MANGPFTPGNGRIAADLFDFHKHVDGTDFKHHAANIIAAPGVGNATNVQTSIDNINAFIASLSGAGKAFVAIPDGYNCYTNPAPNFYFNNAIPSLSDFLIPLFAAIVAGSGIPAGYQRLAKGGVLYIPAGTYYIKTSVSIPPGITILGEGFGTKIINATALNLTLSPPQVNVSATPQPVFKILQDTDRFSVDYKVDSERVFMFSRATKLLNFVIADNFIEPTLLGDVYYGLPQNTTGNSPLILQYQGSSLELFNVYMLGRALATTGVVSSATRFAIALDTASPVTGTYLKISDSFIDGFSQPIKFNSSSGILDYLDISGSKIRSHGYLDSDGTTAEKNTIIHMNDGNANIINNEFYANHNLISQIVYIKNVVAGTLDERAYSKITISNNNYACDKSGTYSAFDVPFTPYTVDTGIIASILSKTVIVGYGNTATKSGRGYIVEMSADGSAQLSITPGDTYINNSSSTNINTNTFNVNAAANIQMAGSSGLLSGTNGVTLSNSAGGALIELNSTGSVNINSSGGNANISTVNVNLSPSTGLTTIGKGIITSGLANVITTPYVCTNIDRILIVKMLSIGANALIKLPVPTLGRNITIKEAQGVTANNIIIDTSTAIQQYAFSNADSYSSIDGTITDTAESFVGDGRVILKITIYVKKTGAPFGTLDCNIYAHSGTFGSGIPTGSILATGSGVATTGITTSVAAYDFTFSGANQIVLGNGTNYFFSITSTAVSAGNTLDFSLDSSSPTYPGNNATRTAGTWTAQAGKDLCFIVYTACKIDGIVGPYTTTAAYGSFNLIADGTDWYLI